MGVCRPLHCVAARQASAIYFCPQIIDTLQPLYLIPAKNATRATLYNLAIRQSRVAISSQMAPVGVDQRLHCITPMLLFVSQRSQESLCTLHKKNQNVARSHTFISDDFHLTLEQFRTSKAILPPPPARPGFTRTCCARHIGVFVLLLARKQLRIARNVANFTSTSMRV